MNRLCRPWCGERSAHLVTILSRISPGQMARGVVWGVKGQADLPLIQRKEQLRGLCPHRKGQGSVGKGALAGIAGCQKGDFLTASLTPGPSLPRPQGCKYSEKQLGDFSVSRGGFELRLHQGDPAPFSCWLNEVPPLSPSSFFSLYC